MAKLKVGFLGGRALGLRCLTILDEYRDKIEMVFVIPHTNPGEKNSDWNPQIALNAKKLGFKVLKVKSLKDGTVTNIIRKSGVDLILNAFCDRFVPKTILDIPPLGVINFHYGKLPKYKGRFIVSHIILNGETNTVATAHLMSEKVDAGDIIYEEPVKVYPTDTARTLYFRCTDAATILFERVLEKSIKGGQLPRKKQRGQGGYFPFEEPNNCEVDLSWSQDKIERFIRAVTFEPISKPWLQIGNLKFDIVLKKL